MSYVATVEMILHLHQFEAIYSRHKSQYQLQVEVVNAHQQFNCMPYNILNQSTKNTSYLSQSIYRSSIFKILYQGQKIKLDEIIQIRLTIPVLPDHKNKNYYLKFKLMQCSYYYEKQQDEFDPFDKSAEYQFKLNYQSLNRGFLCYCVADFTDCNIFKIDFTIFSILCYYSFKGIIKQFSLQNQSKKNQFYCQNLQQLIQSVQKNNQQSKQKHLLNFYCKYIKKLYINFTNLKQLFHNKSKISMKELKLAVPTDFKQCGYVNEREQFVQFINKYFPKTMNINFFESEMNAMKILSFQIVQNVLKEFMNKTIKTDQLRNQYKHYIKGKFEQRCILSISDSNNSLKKSFGQTVKKFKKNSLQIEQITSYPLLDLSKFYSQKNSQYIFLQIKFSKQISSKNINHIRNQINNQKIILKDKLKYNQKNMLIVLVHGYQGSVFDMEVIFRGIKAMLPQACYLISSINQGRTDQSIDSQGYSLAEQIKKYIKHKMQQENLILNLVGHSMGGIVARGSLKYLTKFSTNFGFFFSLSSPHLGYMKDVDIKIKIGLYFMKNIKSLLQLRMEDVPPKETKRSTYGFRLSTDGSLKNFQKIILLSSLQDKYVPWHSARVEPYDKANQDDIERQMVENIIGNNIIHRINIDFGDKGTGINQFIGRAAHINMISQDSLFTLFNETIPNLFDIYSV